MTSDQVKAMREKRDQRIAKLLPFMIEKVKAENPDILNEDHIGEIAMSRVILEIGVHESSQWEGGLECPLPSSTYGKPQGDGSQTPDTFTLEELERDFPPIGETPSESDPTETEDRF